MGEAASTAAAAAASLLATPAVGDDEERYVKVASRFFLVKPAAGGDSVGRPPAHRRHHFLDSCFLCKSSISHDRDIFMYKGDAAFCSEECRQEQVAMDEGLQAAARRRHKQGTAERAAGAARTVMHRRPTIAADLGAVARTLVAAS